MGFNHRQLDKVVLAAAAQGHTIGPFGGTDVNTRAVKLFQSWASSAGTSVPYTDYNSTIKRCLTAISGVGGLMSWNDSVITALTAIADGGGGGGGGLTWIKLQLTDFSDARDAGPVLSSAATQDDDGLITWPCNVPDTYGDLRECASKTMPIADLATIVGLADASTLINGSNVIHVRINADIPQKNVGVMAAYLDRPASNQGGTYGVGVGCFRNTSGTNPKLVGALIHESSTVTNGSGAALMTRSPFCTGVLQHPTVGTTNHYGGHVAIWEYDDPAWVREGGISYTREISAPEDLVHFGIAAWFKASGGVASTMTTTIEVAVQSSAEWSQVST